MTGASSNIRIFIVAILITEALFNQFLIRIAA